MAVAEIRIEGLEVGSIAAGDLVTASLQVLRREAGIQFQVSSTGTVIRGERHRVLAAARLVEKVFCSSCREGYLMTITFNERRNHRAAKPVADDTPDCPPARRKAGHPSNA